jgi:hypothetical protein
MQNYYLCGDLVKLFALCPMNADRLSENPTVNQVHNGKMFEKLLLVRKSGKKMAKNPPSLKQIGEVILWSVAQS